MQMFKYFGTKPAKRNKCCCICDINNNSSNNAGPAIHWKVRKVRATNTVLLEGRKQYWSMVESSRLHTWPFDVKSVSKNLVEKELEYTACEEDLLTNCGIWNPDSSLKIYSAICSYTSLLSGYNTNYFWLCRTE